MVNLYLPITSQPRELDAKLLLALFASAAGMRPYIGYKSTFLAQLAKLESGFFLAHNARQKPAKMAVLRDAGHKLVVLDEEALVRQSDEIFLKKHPEHAFDPVNEVLCWGQDDSEMWARTSILDGIETTVVGNPRMDIIRPEFAAFHAEKIADIRRKHGQYVLLNTNFPTVNNLTPQGGGVRMASWAMDAEGQKINDAFLANKRRLFQAELALIEPLAKMIAPLTLVIRPHPNENHTPWHDVAAKLENVVVEFQGNVVPWLLGAEALIHNSCTTAVEAAVAGTPVINFLPWRSEFDNQLSHSFGHDCANADDIAKGLRQILEGQGAVLSNDQKALLKQHIESVTGDFSCARIAAFLAQKAKSFDVTGGLSTSERKKETARLRRLWLKNYSRLFTSKRGRKKRAFLKQNFPDLSPGRLDFEQLSYSMEQLDLLMRQFPPLQVDALNHQIQRFCDILEWSEPFKCVQHSEYLVTIER